MDNKNLLFSYESKYDYSNTMIKFIEELKIFHQVNIGKAKKIKYNAYGISTYNRIFLLEDVPNQNEYEGTLAHELAHIELIEKGFSLITTENPCFTEHRERCGLIFANLIHHLFIYPKLKKYNINLDYDNAAAIGRVKDLNKYTQDIYSGNKYLIGTVILTLMDDLNRISPSKVEEYKKIVKPSLPRELNQAEVMLNEINKHYKDTTVQNYSEVKSYIENSLQFDEYKEFTKDMMLVYKKEIDELMLNNLVL